MTTKRFKIVDGPGAGATMDAFKYAYSKSHDFDVNFSLRETSDETTISSMAQVVGLSYESGSDGMFIITMHVHIEPFGLCIANGFYDAQRRNGYIDVTIGR